MLSILLSAVFILLCSLGVWLIIRRLHVEHLLTQEKNAEAWKALALKLSDGQADATNRLLIRSGVSPAPSNTPRESPIEIDHDQDDSAWSAEDERLEIEQKAKDALARPLQAELLEEAARYDEHWKPVWERYCELKRELN